MGKVNSISEVNEILNMLGYSWIEGEYMNSLSRIKLSDNNGYLYESTLLHTNARKKLKAVHKLNPYSIHNAKLWISKNIPNLKLLSDSYETTRTYMDFECLECGHLFKSTWTNITSSIGNKKCPMCTNRIPHTEEKVLEIANELNNKIIFSNPRKLDNKDWSLDCKCKECERKWTTKLFTIQRGSGCIECNRGGGNGGYNITRADRHKEEWENINAIVYVINCKNKDEEFIKIGLTSTSVESRFTSKKKFPYKFSIIKEIETNLYSAVYLEKQLQEMLLEYSYTPLAKFQGYTECFTVDALPIIQSHSKEVINEHIKLDSNRRSNIQ